ncbi:MAG TPA: family 43 glycosylhydrolase [Bacteroidales bacterium]|nr:family 43 glycosylhydrolase [Bacteroidales bacterium]
MSVNLIKANDAIRSGIPWFDDSNKTVSAHGACIVQDHGKFYLFGECKSDSSNAFVGFNCYSSTDLSKWKFERQVLPLQKSGQLGPNRVGERVKVMKCPKTGEYVMFMHTDNMGYNDPCIGYATSPTINGEYTYQGALLFNGSPIKKWDMGVFQDADGSGYLLIHHGSIFKLSDDYKRITEQVIKEMGGGESPTVFKKDGIYFWLTSHLTSWERNDNDYYTATSLAGPWTKRGIFAPEGTLTWNSQSTFVLPIYGSKDTTWMFMGDRWSFPCQNAAATYVWQPMIVKDSTISIPKYQQNWIVNFSSGTWESADMPMIGVNHSDFKRIHYYGKWAQAKISDSLSVMQSDAKGATFSVSFKGGRIGFYAMAGPKCGYAKVVVSDKKGKSVVSTLVDLYCLYSETSLKFLSPNLPDGRYRMTVTVQGMHPVWSNKAKKIFGSTGDFVKLDRVVLSNQ